MRDDLHAEGLLEQLAARPRRARPARRSPARWPAPGSAARRCGRTSACPTRSAWPGRGLVSGALRAWPVELLPGDRVGRHDRLPLGPLGVADPDGDRPAERDAVPHAAGQLHLVLLELHPRAAPVARPPPRERRGHVLAGNPHPRRHAVTDRGERLAVRLARRQPPKHAVHPTVRPAGLAPARGSTLSRASTASRRPRRGTGSLLPSFPQRFRRSAVAPWTGEALARLLLLSEAEGDAAAQAGGEAGRDGFRGRAGLVGVGRRCSVMVRSASAPPGSRAKPSVTAATAARTSGSSCGSGGGSPAASARSRAPSTTSGTGPATSTTTASACSAATAGHSRGAGTGTGRASARQRR